MGAVSAAIVSTVVFTGCAAPATPALRPDEMPSGHRAAPSASAYLYAYNLKDVGGSTLVATYPGGKVVKYLPDAGTFCSDPNNGDLYFVNGVQATEYTAGGGSEIASVIYPSGFELDFAPWIPRRGTSHFPESTR